MAYRDISITTELDRLLFWFAEYENKRESHVYEDVLRNFIRPLHSLGEQVIVVDASGVFDACLVKLLKDGFIERIDVEIHGTPMHYVTIEQRYRITYEGLLFLELKGGYIAEENILYQKERESIRKEKQFERIQEEAHQNAKRATLLTLVLAMGTVLSVLIESAEKLHKIVSIEFWVLVSVFSFAGIGTAILGLLLQGRRKQKE